MRKTLLDTRILLGMATAGMVWVALSPMGEAHVGSGEPAPVSPGHGLPATGVFLASTVPPAHSQAHDSSEHPVEQSQAQPLLVPTARDGMDLLRWPQGKFYESLSERIDTLSRTHGDERNSVFLDISELYLGQMLSYEAGSVLEGVAPIRAGDKSRHQTLSDAVRLLEGEELLQGGASHLFSPDRKDMALWVVLDAISRGDAAGLQGSQGAGLLALGQQPLPVAVAVLPILAEAMIETREFRLAAQALRLMDGMPSLAGRPVYFYLKGRASELAGDHASALEAYFKTAEGWDRYAVRGRINLVDMALANKGRGALLAARDVLKHGENAWRGDDYELQVLDRLGQLNVALDAPIRALKTYGKLTMRFPDTPEAEAASIKARALLNTIYERGTQGELTLAEWMSVHFQLVPWYRYYPEFADHTLALADHVLSLGGTDLAIEEYHRAVGLMEELRDQNIQIVPKSQFSEVYLKIAIAQTRGGKVKEALETLQSIPPSGDPEFRNRVTALRAEVLADLGDSEGLRRTYVLKPSARNLRDVALALWEDESWPEAINFYKRLWSEFPGQFSADDASYLLIAAHHSNDEGTTNAVISAFPGMTGSQGWIDLAKGLLEPKSSLEPLSLEAASSRLESLERSLRQVKNTSAVLGDSDL